MSRFGVGNLVGRWLGHGFPWGTLTCNIAGSLVMGILIGLFAHHGTSQTLRAFLAIGFLGAFTTYSSFSLDTITLIERGEAGLAAAYVLGTTVAALAGLAAGLWGMRMVLAA